jgi:hypothetical protein
LDAVAKVELLEDVRDVGLDGGVADVELLADLGVREAAADEPEHVEQRSDERVDAPLAPADPRPPRHLAIHR